MIRLATYVITEIFPQKKALLSIRPLDYTKANELLACAFQDEEARLEEVLSTHTLIAEKHTFDARVSMLKEIVPQIIFS